MTPWGRAITALRLLSADPAGLGGIALHARSGPARDAFIALLPTNRMRLHPALSLDALEGGIDVAASLADGTLVQHRGLLDQSDQMLILSMAERAPAEFVALLSARLDRGDTAGVIALDESAEEDEAPHPALMDRLAFHISLDGLGRHDLEDDDAMPETASARPQVSKVTASDAALDELVTLASALGITSLRAPLFALHAAKANAALNRRFSVEYDDVLIAAELVLAPRATRLPEPPPTEAQPDEPQQTEQRDDNGENQSNPDHIDIPQEILLEAIKTALPTDLLTKTDSTQTRSGSGSGAGQKRTGNRRGRPLPARDGAPRGSQPRVDMIATMRAAVPWQPLRRAQQPDRMGPIIHPRDLRYKRYEELSDRLLIFAVDASGSAALARLAEAKGAIELLLAEAYARRDHVALVSFRGDAAEVLLPPTRSLVRTKRQLAALPGGGGTPLAAGLRAGFEIAQTTGRKGLSPVLIILTDGRSNVALDGSADRQKAAQDAKDIARHIAAAQVQSIVIDTGRRAAPTLRDLATSLRGRYVALPRANAQSLSDTITTALDT